MIMIMMMMMMMMIMMIMMMIPIFGKISHKQNNLDVVITLNPNIYIIKVIIMTIMIMIMLIIMMMIPDRIPACIIIPATCFFVAK